MHFHCSALPTSLTDSAVREVLNNVIREITTLGVEVAGKYYLYFLHLSFITVIGKCTNGEWNTLRCKGNT